MKIMYIANGNGLSGNVGGSMIRSTEIARRLSKRGCEIHFLTTTGDRKACYSENLDVCYHIVRASLFKRRETSLFDRAMGYIISTLASLRVLPALPRCS